MQQEIYFAVVYKKLFSIFSKYLSYIFMNIFCMPLLRFWVKNYIKKGFAWFKKEKFEDILREKKNNKVFIKNLEIRVMVHWTENKSSLSPYIFKDWLDCKISLLVPWCHGKTGFLTSFIIVMLTLIVMFWHP